ncbi:MAG: hypothetical protein DDT19_01501 [Syntrophomonadaceae bacterium]|nr:hypothetical protein [Bacillota bacterium]
MTRQWEIASRSRPNNKWVVTLKENDSDIIKNDALSGVFHCNCPDHGYRKVSCYHINEAKHHLEKEISSDISDRLHILANSLMPYHYHFKPILGLASSLPANKDTIKQLTIKAKQLSERDGSEYKISKIKRLSWELFRCSELLESIILPSLTGKREYEGSFINLNLICSVTGIMRKNLEELGDFYATEIGEEFTKKYMALQSKTLIKDNKSVGMNR